MSDTGNADSKSVMHKRVRAVEAELKQARSLLGAVFDEGPFPMWISDDRGTCIRVNEANRRKWGLTDEAVVGRYNLFEDPVLREQGHIPLIESVFRDGRTVSFQNDYDPVRFNQLTGANRDHKTVIEATVTPVRNSRGKVTHAIIQQTDLTGLKLAEEEKDEAVRKIKQAHKMEAAGLLAAGVAHEMSQPLTSIRAIFERTLHDLEQQKIDPRDLSENFREGVSQINRISRVICHLRVHARAEPVSLENTQLETMLDDVLILIGPMLQVNGIELIRDIQEDLPPLLCDAYRCEQILVRLFQNATEALMSVQDKRIIVSVKAGETHLTLCIKHNGVGRAPGFHDKKSGSAAAADEVEEGTGVGLSIVYDYVKEHKGDIQYVPEAQGSSFIITLPLQAGSS